MVEPCFNELTINPFCSSDEEMEQQIDGLISTLKSLEQRGIKRVRYENSFNDIKLREGYTLLDYCNKAIKGKQINNRNFLYGFLRKPYLYEEEEVLFDKYDNCKFISENGNTEDCLGLYIAFVMNSFAVGFDNGIFKDNQNLSCHLRLTKNGETINKHVPCVTKPEHIFTEEIVEILSNQHDLLVDKTSIPIENKKVHVAKHHGKKECLKHANELRSSPYVTEILNSIDFDCNEKQYIHKIAEPNLIEIRLYWTKKGYGLCVATTGKDIIQTRWIAKHMNKIYGKSSK